MPSIAANGSTFHYRFDGPDEGSVVMLSNSLASNLTMWDLQVPALVAAGYRVLRYDSRGHGRSAVPSIPYSMDQLTADAVALLDALGLEKVHFCGLSMGGMVGQTLGARYGNRLLSLILSSTSAFMAQKEVWHERLVMAITKGMPAMVDATIDRWFTKEGQERLPEEVEKVRQMILATPVEGFCGSGVAIRDMDLRSLHKEIRTPTLVLVGEHDPGTPVAAAEEIHGAIAGSRLIVYSGAAHFCNVEKADLFNRDLLAFLKQHDGSSAAAGSGIAPPPETPGADGEVSCEGEGMTEENQPIDVQQEEPDLFQQIEEYILTGENIGIDPRVFHILDNTDSSEPELAGIEKMIDVKLALRLRNMANSVYYGMHRHGQVNKFNDVITSIGMQPAKLFIIALALFARLAEEHKMIEIESFTVSFFAKLFAEHMSLNKVAVERAEIGGLFLNLGRVLIAIYATEKRVEIPPGFMEKYHQEVAVKIIEKLTLPDYLSDVILENYFSLKKDDLSVPGVVFLAKALVEKIIRENRLIAIKSPMPDLNDNLETTIGLKIQQYFSLIGLGNYLRVMRG